MTDLTSSTETDQVFAAFIAAQADFLHVTKGGTVPLTKTGLAGPTAKFATFPDAIEALRPILNANGLGLVQRSLPATNGVRVATTLVHASGQWVSDDGTFIPAAKMDPMGYGSALSYAKRYGLLTMLGVATDDDDGAAALKGFERQQAHEVATAAAAAVQKVDDRQFGTLFAVAKAVSPSTPDERLNLRYKDLPAADFASTLRTGLEHAAKQNVIEAATADDVFAAAIGDTPLEQIQKLIAGVA